MSIVLYLRCRDCGNSGQAEQEDGADSDSLYRLFIPPCGECGSTDIAVSDKPMKECA